MSRILLNDSNHSRARAWLDDAIDSDETFAGPSLLPIEAAGAVSRRLGNPLLGVGAAEQLFALPGFELVVLSDEIAEAAMRLAADLRLRGTDAVFVATARALGLPLVTLDQEILTRAAGTIEVFAPP